VALGKNGAPSGKDDGHMMETDGNIWNIWNLMEREIYIYNNMEIWRKYDGNRIFPAFLNDFVLVPSRHEDELDKDASVLWHKFRAWSVRLLQWWVGFDVGHLWMIYIPSGK
jgi:hypothetical protein